MHPLLCRVVSVEALGHGAIGRVMTLAQARDDSSPQAVFAAAALATSSSSNRHSTAAPVIGRTSAAESACKCLLKAPMLSELHDWTNWHLLFEQELGPLSDFTRHQGGLLRSLALQKLCKSCSNWAWPRLLTCKSGCCKEHVCIFVCAGLLKDKTVDRVSHIAQLECTYASRPASILYKSCALANNDVAVDTRHCLNPFLLHTCLMLECPIVFTTSQPYCRACCSRRHKHRILPL